MVVVPARFGSFAGGLSSIQADNYFLQACLDGLWVRSGFGRLKASVKPSVYELSAKPQKQVMLPIFLSATLEFPMQTFFLDMCALQYMYSIYHQHKDKFNQEIPWRVVNK